MNYENAIFGGLLIGSAALLMYATLGRIAGISGIAFGLLWQSGDRAWRLAFLLGLVIAPWLMVLAGLVPPVERATPAGAAALLIPLSGLLVGAGTRLGNGCTSGHGVCGIARLSPRSLASVIVFMSAGALAATFIRPWIA